MTIGEVLVLVDDAPSWSGRIDVALDLARRHDAHLVGLRVSEPIVLYSGYGVMPGTVVAELEETRRATLAAEAARFQERMRHAGCEATTEWRDAEGPLAETIALQARYADLTVISQGDPEQGGPAVEMPGEVALLSGRPVLVVPFRGADRPIGQRVLVAWNASREAARAVADAMSILQEAEEVLVLTVSEAGMRELAGRDLARFLGRHGVRTDVTSVASGGLEAGEVVLEVAKERGSDLVVMGCYGRSRWREAVLGRASRTVLRTTPLPLLMSH